MASSNNKIAMIAGRGALPRVLAERLAVRGPGPLIFGVVNEHEEWIREYDHEILGWGQFGKLFRALEERGVSQILLAGAFTRPAIEITKMDWEAIKTLPQVLGFMIGGDNSLLSGVIKVFEKRGVEVVAAQDIMPELLAPRGALVGRKPNKKANYNMKRASEATQILGQLDIGQAAVAVGGRVVAVEGVEGTDGMLSRIKDLRASGKLTENGKNGVLVKAIKPNQDIRVDLPTVGADTAIMAHEAGLAGIAVHAGHSFILDREEMIQNAKERGLFVFGFADPNGIV